MAQDRETRHKGRTASRRQMTQKLLLFLLGITAIVIGSQLLIDYGSELALLMRVPASIIGVTMVAIGTSLPELVTSVVAAKKGEAGLSIGNALGSNIMNIGFILGLSSAIHPIAVVPENMIDICILLAVALLIVVMAWRSDKMNRPRGWLFLGLYLGYFVYILLR